jgi:predicted DNA-binding transcriptional regulator AlpA
MYMNQQYEERLLKRPEVLATVGMTKSSWYRGVRSGKHPHPIKRSTRDAVWLMSDIQKIVSDTVAGSMGQAV